MMRDNANANDSDHTPIEIVTWYLADPLSWAPLASLLSTNARYSHLQKLEVVEPTEAVPEESLQLVLQYIQHSRTLKELVVFTQNPNHDDHDSSWRRLEAAVKANNSQNDSTSVIDFQIQGIQIGSRKALCDTLTPNETRPRHLCLDGDLLQGMAKFGWADLGKHLAWDRSMHTLVLKDLDHKFLPLACQKIAHGTVQTLKIIYSLDKQDNNNNSSSHQRRAAAPVDIPTTPGLTALLQSEKVPLRRLVFVNCHFHPTNTEPLVEALKLKESLRQLEFCLCQFDAGTGTQLKKLVKDNQTLRQVSVQYPIFDSRRSNDDYHNKDKGEGNKLSIVQQRLQQYQGVKT